MYIEDFIGRKRGTKQRTFLQALRATIGLGFFLIALTLFCLPPPFTSLADSLKYLAAVAFLLFMGVYIFLRAMPKQKYPS